MAKKKAKKKAKSRRKAKAQVPAISLDLVADLDRRVTRLEEHCGFKQPEPDQEPQTSDVPAAVPAPG